MPFTPLDIGYSGVLLYVSARTSFNGSDLKIVSWNCNGALRNKFECLAELGADVYIIQECEDPAAMRHPGYRQWAQNYVWIGDSASRGLGIFSPKDLRIEPLDWSNTYQDHQVKHFLPCSINNDITILAVWTHQNNSPTFGYIGQFWKYLQTNKLQLKDALIAGDFNSNALWDTWDRWWNHSDVVRELGEIGIESLYHSFTKEAQGKETQPTFFMHRKLARPYHIDYFFGGTAFLNHLINLEIGATDPWLKISDHLPIIAEFNKHPVC
jgi:exonuclease III